MLIRAAILWFLLLACCGPLFAQQQERTLERRIMKPNMTLTANEQNRGFGNGKSFSSNDSSTSGKAKSFSGLRQFSLKRFFTRSYHEEKSFATGDYQPGQKASSDLNQPGNAREAGQGFGTKSMPVSTAREGTKSYNAQETFQARGAVVEGKSQKALDQQHPKKELSIDEVREILNKNK